MKKIWKFLETNADFALMSQVLNIHEITANCLANRGIRTKNTAINFLNPSISDFADFFDMKDTKKSVELILCAIKQNKRITIYGDYDVDGIMSTTILYKTLKSLNATVDFYIPHRIEEGYGLNINAIDKITADMIITVDNGISAIPEIQHAIKQGLEVIIIDHHEPGEILPPAQAIVDPKQNTCEYKDKNYCAAGLSFRLAEKLLQTNRKLLNELIVFAAIATICDIVPLLGENRIIVKQGLDIINKHKLINPGLGTLITARGYLDKPIDVHTIGFIIGPCLNATGRLETASKAVELLISNSQSQQADLSKIFIKLNDERKTLTEQCVNRALKAVESNLDNVVILVDNEAHESVAGIAAGRIRDKICRPVIMITKGIDDMKGSGRSIDNYNMYEELYAHKHLLERFGGHAMAAGLSILPENIEKLRLLLNKSCKLNESDFAQIFHIDRELDPKDIKLNLALELEKLAPFGKSNKEPLFVSYGLLVESLRNIPEKNTMIFNFKNLKGIAFGLNDMYSDKLVGSKIDVVYLIEKNVYNGSTTVQMRIKDFKEVP